jgi:hypothetical protein
VSPVTLHWNVHEILGHEIGNSSHRPLLLLALEETRTSGQAVLEMGMGDGSTPYLHRYCAKEKRVLFSVDNNKDWVAKYKCLEEAYGMHRVVHDPNWNITHDGNYSVVLIDHAPEERRHVDVERLAHRAQILVLHDTEPESPGYLYDRIWGLFRYRCNIVVPYTPENPLASAAAVSNYYDLTQWAGTTFPNYPYQVTL